MTYNPHLPNKDVQLEHDLMRRLSVLERGHGITGYRLHDILYYESSDTFTKGNYSGLRVIRVQMVGGGGGGGGNDATGAGEHAWGIGGSGAGYAESWISVTDLDAGGEAITVGAAGSTGAGAAGGNGGDSIFDTISGEVRAKGGVGGGERTPTSGFASNNPADSQTGNVGDLTIDGGRGDASHSWLPDNQLRSGGGGDSPMGFGLGGPGRVSTGAGIAAKGYGGGGGGSASGVSQSGQTGGTAGPGIVIVHLYV